MNNRDKKYTRKVKRGGGISKTASRSGKGNANTNAKAPKSVKAKVTAASRSAKAKVTAASRSGIPHTYNPKDKRQDIFCLSYKFEGFVPTITCNLTIDQILAQLETMQILPAIHTQIKTITLYYPDTNVTGSLSIRSETWDKASFNADSVMPYLNKALDTYMTSKNSGEYLPLVQSTILDNELENELKKNRKDIGFGINELIAELTTRFPQTHKNITDVTPNNLLHSEIQLEALGDFIVAQLGYAISNDVTKTVLASPTSKTFLSTYNSSDTFTDINTSIDKIHDLSTKNLCKIYHKNYQLLQSMCFILHDKPSKVIVKPLFECMLDRSKKTVSDLLFNTYILPLWHVWYTGFTDTNGPIVTAKRCHDTLNSLFNVFKTYMSGVGIIVPEMITIFSIPYKFILDDQINTELSTCIGHFKYGLTDALGNDKFIIKYRKKPITVATTVAFQDAAQTPKLAVNRLQIIETTVPTAATAATRLQGQYTIHDDDPVNSISWIFKIEPLRFGDISIYHNKAQTCNLYYAAILCFSDVAQAEIAAAGARSESALVQTNGNPLIIIDEGVQKILIAVVSQPVSQNETIPLIKYEYPGIISSARGNNRVSEADTMRKITLLKFTRCQDNITSLNREIRLILAVFVKEAGDQSKIQIVENLSKNEFKTYITTCDGYLSKSMNNGGVLFKGGKVEFSEPAGFKALTDAERDTLNEVTLKMNIYTFAKFYESVKLFIDNVKILLTSYMRTHVFKTKLPIPLQVTYLAIYCTIDTILPNKVSFNSYVTTYDKNKHTGIYDMISLVRRLIPITKITDIFVIYNNHIDNPFKITSISTLTKYRYNLQDMLNEYGGIYINKTQNLTVFMVELVNLFNMAPLFFLMEEIPKLNVILRFRVFDSHGKTTGGPRIYACTIYIYGLRQIFVDKYENFKSLYLVGSTLTGIDVWNNLINANRNLDAAKKTEIIDTNFIPSSAEIVYDDCDLPEEDEEQQS